MKKTFLKAKRKAEQGIAIKSSLRSHCQYFDCQVFHQSPSLCHAVSTDSRNFIEVCIKSVNIQDKSQDVKEDLRN